MQKFVKIIFIAISMEFFANILYAEEAVHPAKSRECYSCEGISCTLRSKLNNTVQCPSMLDVCVTIFNNFSVAARGCYSEIPEYLREKCAEIDNPECLKCFGQLCNNKGRADVKCIECNSRNNSKCITNPSAFTPVTCEIPTAQYSYCYIHDSRRGFMRGCYPHTLEQDDCLKDGDCSLCFSHDGNICNNYKIVSLSNKNKQNFWLQLTIILPFILAGVLK